MQGWGDFVISLSYTWARPTVAVKRTGRDFSMPHPAIAVSLIAANPFQPARAGAINRHSEGLATIRPERLNRPLRNEFQANQDDQRVEQTVYKEGDQNVPRHDVVVQAAIQKSSDKESRNENINEV